jgi:hypothetical protein
MFAASGESISCCRKIRNVLIHVHVSILSQEKWFRKAEVNLTSTPSAKLAASGVSISCCCKNMKNKSLYLVSQNILEKKIFFFQRHARPFSK